MSTTRIKVCGVTRVEDALLAADLGAHAIGMIFTASPRAVEPEVARRICAALPAHVDRVGVFRDAPLEAMLAITAAVPLTRIQLHGREDPQLGAALPGALTRGLEDSLEGGLDELLAAAAAWRSVRPDVDILVDLPKDRRPKGHDLERGWSIARDLGEHIPVVLAGGLDPDNVLRALRRARPVGVDVARGVEASAGIKDPDRLRAFFRAVQQYDLVRGVPA